MSSGPQVRVFNSSEELFHGAAEKFVDLANRAIADRGKFTVALSGGSTPRAMHQELVRNFSSKLAWEQIFFFFGDERHVPPDSPESNYRMANETLLSKLPVPRNHIFRFPAELPDANRAANDYAETLRKSFSLTGDAFPRFDFVLLGMGPDGHTASLFPGSAALEEKRHWVVANWVEQFKTFRLTFTYPVLNHAASVMFLVSGEDKADMVPKALRDPSANLPCQRVRPVNGELMWYMDAPAGAKL
jgi:6-phosphogluconolactonase